MALDRFNENMDIIAGLGDDPKRDDGLSTPQFKSVFDKAGLLIQKFLNEKLIPQVENFLDEGTVLGKITEALSRKLDKTGGTMEGPINMNGQKLSGLNEPTADDDAATKGFVTEAVKDKVDKSNVVNNFTTTEEGYVADARALKALNDSKMSMELLWQNGSPGSEFGTQTIALDLTQYEAVAVSFWHYTSYVGKFSAKMWIALKGYDTVGFTIYEDPDSAGFMYRSFTCDDNGVHFRNGFEVGKKVLDKGAIPNQIYGIKFFGGVSE